MLYLDANLPKWAQRECARAYDYNILAEWEAHVYWVGPTQISASNDAECTFDWVYRHAVICLANTLKGASGRSTIQHEFRHLFYARLSSVIDQAIDAKLQRQMTPKATKALGARLLADEIERLIELDLEARGYSRQ